MLKRVSITANETGRLRTPRASWGYANAVLPRWVRGHTSGTPSFVIPLYAGLFTGSGECFTHPVPRLWDNGSQPCDSLVAFNQTIIRATELRKGGVMLSLFLAGLLN